MLSYLSRASLGLSTMVDEHFGINVVEFMVSYACRITPLFVLMAVCQAAGVIPVAHASAGPLLDIIVPVNGQPTGFHAKDVSEFAQAVHAALSLSEDEVLAMRERGRTLAAGRFSEQEFEKSWDESGWRQWL